MTFQPCKMPSEASEMTFQPCKVVSEISEASFTHIEQKKETKNGTVKSQPPCIPSGSMQSSLKLNIWLMFALVSEAIPIT